MTLQTLGYLLVWIPITVAVLYMLIDLIRIAANDSGFAWVMGGILCFLIGFFTLLMSK